MRLSIVLPTLTGCLLVCSAVAYGQQPQGLVSCKPASQKTGDVGCWILTNFPVGTPAGPVYWTLDTFGSRDIAEQARGPQSVVLESLGKVWVSTVGDRPKEVPGGTRVTVVGPLTVRPGVSYAAQVMEATLRPGMVSKTHLHSGVEAFYTESGASCLETPAGKQIGKKGSDIVVPEGVPMELTAVGPDTRRGLILILHDASKPPTTLVEDWKSKHLCTVEK